MTTSSDDAGTARLSSRIRDATWDAHQDAEHAPFIQDLLAGRLPVADYARLAAQHHAIYTELELAVEGNTDPTLAPFLAPELIRLPSIAADLEFLAGPDWSTQIPIHVTTDTYCAHLRALSAEWPGGLLAHHYVRYLGDLSGGQVIGRVLQRIYQFADHRGTAFYRFPEIRSPKAFKDRYRQLLDDLPWDETQQQRLIDEVNRAYRLNADIFFDLAPLPVFASQQHRLRNDGAPASPD